ncbi:hypothetical protein [Tenacibaculum finnmarkense]|uniref:Uncharacterized protein n=2 Tax=Tenacibaculum finnmarkense TaxID=2781243 RepID=A0A2I2M7W9_9FLAO|nr:hypothetical protein [Tenacibaculum finnmarkense]MBE7632876.1 hypothetical protein [Tenacibaculum finnmarkense genomovar ulcerans]MBE7652251.1 hypothetical protein [Tenacibaculum finnmarkense genomovar finnmarkense]MBE7694577.1 hypothetical protein [Tenacibaculum finnmarkense genomovar finnmarkense]MBE7697183.1 hypothetical protein [Tenacibaculum finnmarkense genomovar ulcerans]MCD8422122.1 hypothetical protein [Tenacibaculum finnmarkense genomovar ulcerans]
MKNLDFCKELSSVELVEINGGGLVEDIGYAAHAVSDGICTAGRWVADRASDAWDWCCN